MQLEREKMVQAQRMARDEAMRADAARQAELGFKYASISSSERQSELERASRDEAERLRLLAQADDRQRADDLARELAEKRETGERFRYAGNIDAAKEQEKERERRSEEKEERAKRDALRKELISYGATNLPEDVTIVGLEAMVPHFRKRKERELEQKALAAEFRKEGIEYSPVDPTSDDYDTMVSARQGYALSEMKAQKRQEFDDKIAFLKEQSKVDPKVASQKAWELAIDAAGKGIISREEVPSFVTKVSRGVIEGETPATKSPVALLNAKQIANPKLVSEDEKTRAEEFHKLLSARQESTLPWYSNLPLFNQASGSVFGGLADAYVSGQPVRKGLYSNFGPALEADLKAGGVQDDELARAIAAWKRVYTPDEIYP